jgi:pyruvate dehydrogenase E2 component (dihydrolipoamide acetyltransferase)
MQLLLGDSDIAYDYAKTSSDHPPVLFMHGALGVRSQFDGLRGRFPECSHLAVDFPAHGESRVTGGAMNSERLAHDMLALLDALKLEKVDIIGHSMGGYVGLVMAHLAPGRVNTVVTYGTKFYWDDATIGKTAGELDPASLRAKSARYYEALVASHTGGGADQALAFTRSLIADFSRWRLNEEMVRTANVPLLVSAGDRDALVPAAEVMQLYGTMNSKSHAAAIVPGAPHPLQQLPLECFEHIVRQFWSLSAGR